MSNGRRGKLCLFTVLCMAICVAFSVGTRAENAGTVYECEGRIFASDAEETWIMVPGNEAEKIAYEGCASDFMKAGDRVFFTTKSWADTEDESLRYYDLSTGDSDNVQYVSDGLTFAGTWGNRLLYLSTDGLFAHNNKCLNLLDPETEEETKWIRNIQWAGTMGNRLFLVKSDSENNEAVDVPLCLGALNAEGTGLDVISRKAGASALVSGENLYFTIYDQEEVSGERKGLWIVRTGASWQEGVEELVYLEGESCTVTFLQQEGDYLTLLGQGIEGAGDGLLLVNTVSKDIRNIENAENAFGGMMTQLEDDRFYYVETDGTLKEILPGQNFEEICLMKFPEEAEVKGIAEDTVYYQLYGVLYAAVLPDASAENGRAETGETADADVPAGRGREVSREIALEQLGNLLDQGTGLNLSDSTVAELMLEIPGMEQFCKEVSGTGLTGNLQLSDEEENAVDVSFQADASRNTWNLDCTLDLNGESSRVLADGNSDRVELSLPETEQHLEIPLGWMQEWKNLRNSDTKSWLASVLETITISVEDAQVPENRIDDTYTVSKETEAGTVWHIQTDWDTLAAGFRNVMSPVVSLAESVENAAGNAGTISRVEESMELAADGIRQLGEKLGTRPVIDIYAAGNELRKVMMDLKASPETYSPADMNGTVIPAVRIGADPDAPETSLTMEADVLYGHEDFPGGTEAWDQPGYSDKRNIKLTIKSISEDSFDYSVSSIDFAREKRTQSASESLSVYTNTDSVLRLRQSLNIQNTASYWLDLMFIGSEVSLNIKNIRREGDAVKADLSLIFQKTKKMLTGTITLNTLNAAAPETAAGFGAVGTAQAETGKGFAPEDLKFVSREGEEEKVWLDGTAVESAAVYPGINNAQPGAEEQYAVSIVFDPEGTKLFAEATQELLGKRLYIVLGEEVISAPVIQQLITEGTAVISGLESLEEAEELAKVLNGQ